MGVSVCLEKDPKTGVHFQRVSNLLPVGKGMYTEVDPDVFEWANQEKWFVRDGYVIHTKTHRRLHRMIMKPSVGMVVDHINGNTLDNRRSNLRVCTQHQNTCNRSPNRNPGRSRFKGVWWAGPETARKPWRAQIKHKGKQYYLGCYETEEAAARAFDIAAKHYRGEFAKLNFPEAARG